MSNSRFRLLCIALTLIWIASFSRVMRTSAASGQDDSQTRLENCWIKQVEGQGEPCFDVDEALKARFAILVESWRRSAVPSQAGIVIRSVEYREKNRTDVLLAAEIRGIAIAGPISLGVESNEGGRLRIVSLSESPSSPPPILSVTGILCLLYIVCGLVLFLKMKRDPEFLRHEEGNWSKRQAFLTFYPTALFLPLILLLASLTSIGQDSSFLLWIAYRKGLSGTRIENAFLLFSLLLYAAVLVCYSLPYFESLRRGPKAIRETAPERFTGKTIAVEFTKLGLVQAISGFLLWGLAMLLARRFGFPILLSAAIASIVGVVAGQWLFVYWVRRKSVRHLPENDPALAEAMAAFEEANASIARKSIAVLPKDHWPGPNAFVIGLGRKRCLVAVTEPLLEHLSDEEVGAVLLHEYGHVKELHTSIMALFVAMMGAWQLEFLAQGKEWLRSLGLSSATSIFLVRQAILYGGLFVGLLIPFTLISRWCERRADRFAQSLGRGAALASALNKISIVTETPLEWPKWVRIVATHPSFIERIQTLRNQISASSKP